MKIDKKLINMAKNKATTKNNNKDGYITNELKKIYQRLENTQENITEMIEIINMAEKYRIEEIQDVSKRAGNLFIDNSCVSYIPDDNCFRILVPLQYNELKESKDANINNLKGYMEIVVGKGHIEVNPLGCKFNKDLKFKTSDSFKIIPDLSDYVSCPIKINATLKKILYRESSNSTYETYLLQKINDAINVYEQFEEDINNALIQYTTEKTKKNSFLSAIVNIFTDKNNDTEPEYVRHYINIDNETADEYEIE